MSVVHQMIMVYTLQECVMFVTDNQMESYDNGKAGI